MWDEVYLSYHVDAADASKLVPARVERNETGNWSLRLLPGTTNLSLGKRPAGPQYAAWIPRYLSRPLRRSRDGASQTAYGSRKDVPLDGFNHKSHCWALLERMSHPRRHFEFWSVKQIGDDASRLAKPHRGEAIAEGYLCLTNQNIENKHDERFFFYETGVDNAPSVPLSDKVRKDYRILIHDYQSRHEGRVNERQKPEEIEGDKPAFSRFIVHKDQATLKDGDLVYAFLNSSRAVEFIAPVSVPRVAYEFPIAALLPDQTLAFCNHYEHLCPACRVFGWVHQRPDEETERVAYAGRVRFSNAILAHSAGTLPPTPLAILSSPKPTTTRFYLMPADGRISETWTSDQARKGYDRGNTLRGRKFYRHHGSAREREYRRAGDRLDDQNRTVRDALLPGARFEFTVSFENLAPVELGALLWSLHLGEQGFHRLGFAKPLGFGSVAVKVNELRQLSLTA